jgi:hypothetical protein
MHVTPGAGYAKHVHRLMQSICGANLAAAACESDFDCGAALATEPVAGFRAPGVLEACISVLHTFP